MSQRYFDLTPTEEENKIPELVHLETQFRVFPELKDHVTGKPYHDREIIAVQHTVSFDIASVSFLGFEFDYGIVGGRHSLILDGCEMRMQYWCPAGNLAESITLSKSISKETTIDRTIDISNSIEEVAGTLLSGLLKSGNDVIKEEITRRLRFSFSAMVGSPANPRKVFRASSDESYILGTTKAMYFGLIFVNSDEFSIESLFEIRQRDIRVIADAPWTPNAASNIPRRVQELWIRKRLAQSTRPLIRSRYSAHSQPRALVDPI